MPTVAARATLVRAGSWHPLVGRTLPSVGQSTAGSSLAHLCRTPSVRTAVVPKAADGQSVDGSVSSLG
jgi:hypothetical protein